MSKGFHKYFGISLNDIVSKEGSVVPNLLQKLTCYLLEYGVDTEGIFRVNGSSKNVEKLRSQFEKKGDVDLESFNDAHSVASLLKMFLRDLPDTLIPAAMTPLFVSVQQASVKDTKTQLTSSIRNLINSLPPVNRRILKYLTAFLVLASLHSPHSKMTPSAISTVFGPNVFKCGPGFSGLKEQGETNCVMLQMITKYDDIFLHHPSHLSPYHPNFTMDYLLKEELLADFTDSTLNTITPHTNHAKANSIRKISHSKHGLANVVASGGYGKEMMEDGRDEKKGGEVVGGSGEAMCPGFNNSKSFMDDNSVTLSKNRSTYGAEPLFSDIVQLHIDRMVSKFLHVNSPDNDDIDTFAVDTDSFFTVSKVTAFKSPTKTTKKPLSVSCNNINNNNEKINNKNNNIHSNIHNNNNNIIHNTNNTRGLRASSFDNIKTALTLNKHKSNLDDQFSMSDEDDELEDEGDVDSVGLHDISSSVEDGDEKNDDDDVDDEDDDDTIRDNDDSDMNTLHQKVKKDSEKKQTNTFHSAMVSISLLDHSGERHNSRYKSSKKKITCDSHTSDSNTILKAKALYRSIQINNQKLHKLETSTEDDRGKKLRHEDASARGLRKDIHKAKLQLQDLGKEYDKGVSLEQAISITETYDILMQRLSAKRKTAGRPEDPMKMTQTQIADEKMAVQKVLLQFEGLHGRPNTAATKGIVLPLYERYRHVKRLIASKSSLSNPESEGFFESTKHSHKPSKKIDYFADTNPHHPKHKGYLHSSSSFHSNQNSFSDDTDAKNYNTLPLSNLLVELEDARDAKRDLQVELQLFEQSFANRHGRKIQKADQMLKEKDYRRYKNTKSKIKLLEVLVTKKQDH